MRANLNRRWGMTLFGIFLMVSAPTFGQGPQKPTPFPEFVDAEGVGKARDTVGPKLIAILADEKRPAEVRLEAAMLLGKLQYAPAIPTLIQFITMEKPVVVARDGPEFPCRDALQLFGDAAVPSLVDAFVAVTGRGQDRLHCLYMAITLKSRPAARTYAKGLATQNPDPEFQERIEYFLHLTKPR